MTTSFQEYVCWRDDGVLAVTPRDAASLTDGRFQAIHHPLGLRRRRLDERSGGIPATENDVLDALRGPLRPDGYLFIPIVGGSGTGKSHLVRWVKEQTEGESGWEVRYLPKNRTGLRRAIEIVIRDLTGPRIDEAREALQAAPSHHESDDILAERLLDELALLIGQLESPGDGPRSDQRVAMMRKKLSRALPGLLHDPVVRRKLVADGAVIQRLVGLALRGREEGDGLDDDATHFMDNDFPLTFEEIGDASKEARDLLRQLATIPQLKDAAVSVKNETLPAAEKRVAVSNQVDLVEVFREVRRSLFADGKQLVFFVEDLTVLHGVEREFLDAIVEPTHSADGDMCDLRMIFAVTEGHFDGLDTVRTRCDDAYWLDAPYNDDGVNEEEALSFLGRYLNAARLDPAEIDKEWSARDKDVNNWLRNACNACPHQESCHATFGISREGYGLYPMNKSAAGRFVSALSDNRFDPRVVVREVVNRFLLQGAGDLRRGEFPTSSTLAPFDENTEPLPALFATRVRALRPLDYDRVGNILRFWSSDSPVEVSDAILDALGIGDFAADLGTLAQLLGSGPGVDVDTSTEEEKRPKVRLGIEDRLKAASRKQFDELAAWYGGKVELSATTTRTLRAAIHKVVLENLEVGSIAVNLGADFDTYCFRDADIVISGSVTRQDSDTAAVVVDRNLENGAALQALILAKDLASDDHPQSAVYRHALAAAVERWTSSAVAKVTGPVAGVTTATVEGAVVASAVLGDLGGASTPADYIAAIFAESNAPAISPNRSAKWGALVAKAGELKPRLQKRVEAEFGEARGKAGGVRMVKADRLAPIVKAYASQWEMDSSDPAIAGFLRSVVPAVEQEWQSLESRVSAAREVVDTERVRPWVEQTAMVLSVLRAAHLSGRLSDGDAVEDLSAMANRNPARALRAFGEAVESLARSTTLQEKLTILSSDIPDCVSVVHQFAVRATAAIQSVERDLASRQAAAGGATSLEQAVAGALEATTRFETAVKELGR